MAHRLACVLHVLHVPRASTHTDAVVPGLACVHHAPIAMTAACVPDATFAAAAAEAAVATAAASNAVRLFLKDRCILKY